MFTTIGQRQEVLSQAPPQPLSSLSPLSQQDFFSEWSSCFSQDVFSVFSLSEDFPHANTVLVGMTNNMKKMINICVLFFIKFGFKDNKFSIGFYFCALEETALLFFLALDFRIGKKINVMFDRWRFQY